MKGNEGMHSPARTQRASLALSEDLVEHMRESSHGCCGSGRTIFVFTCSCSCTVVCLIVARQALPPCVAAAQHQQRWQQFLLFTARCVVVLDPGSNSKYLERPRTTRSPCQREWL